ncbi:hypothetical protein D3Y57_14365 [Sphingomonas paeninsulae]|uniref:Transglycosylase SLT domain-containing protein n=1 Tax=Sphingomonas paeninsulae TaxID=2319844 RepID=A0A494TBX0_SPHPE|nr:hypothetical protein [Sphingomonas paeninsulae]AYJ86907.1 hypothetical protein D3Y57_14365 [Sphingomonas paeninsulae]
MSGIVDDTTLQAAADRHGIPMALLRAVGTTESGLNPDIGNARIKPAMGNDTHRGAFQISGALAKQYGINPDDGAQAADAAARYLKEGLDKFGNPDDAVRYFHGGPNQSNWGPRTADHHDITARNLQTVLASGGPTQAQSGAADNPYEAALSGSSGSPGAPPVPAAADNPYEAALGAPTTPTNGNVALPPASAGGYPDRSSGGARVPDQLHPSDGSRPGQSWGQWAAGLTPATDAIFNGRNFIDSTRDADAGILSGIATVPETVLHAAGGAINNIADPVQNWFADHGLGHRAPTSLSSLITGQPSNPLAAALHSYASRLEGGTQSLAADPNSSTFGAGKLAGMIGATAPVSEINLLRSGEGAGGLAAALTKYGNMAIQGGTAGALASGGHDVLENTAGGALLAPLVGAGAEHLLPGPANAISKLAAALKGKNADTVPSIATPAYNKAAAETIVDMVAKGEPDAAIRAYGEANGGTGNLDEVLDYRAKNGPYRPAIGVKDAPRAITPTDVSDALGSRGSASGLEATSDLPPSVATHVQKLQAEGVPLDHALREAEITYVGAKPTIAAVTRDPAQQQAANEGAKLVTTPEGRALNAQLASNNHAVNNAMQDLVARYGGVPSSGEAAETAAAALAKSADASKANVTDLYAKARQADGDQTVSIDPVRELLATPEFKSPMQASSREFVSGFKTLADEISSTNRNRFSPSDVEKLRQAANESYDPMGGQVNSFVGKAKSALDQSMDQFDNAGPAHKLARQAHRVHAEAYDDPAGVDGLIRRDVKGNFSNADNWRQAENSLIGTSSDRAFAQVTRQLKADKAGNALDRMKASILQRAYDAASKGATDSNGNAVVSGRAWFQELNKIGSTKLRSLFSKDEIAEIASIGRAAQHMHEPVPGTSNFSNTNSAYLNSLPDALDRANSPGKPTVVGKVAKVAGHLAAGHFMPGVGNVALEGGAHLVGHMKTASDTRALAKALMQSMNPASARAAASAESQRLAEALRRAGNARRFSDRAGALVPAGQEKRPTTPAR